MFLWFHVIPVKDLKKNYSHEFFAIFHESFKSNIKIAELFE